MSTQLLRGLSRRGLLRAGASALLAAGVWPGRLWADAPAAEEFRFCVINDLHYTDAGCGPFFQKLVKQVKADESRFDFCILAGDLTEHGTVEQINGLRDIFKTLGMPVKVVIGNHDHRPGGDRKAWDEAYPNALNYAFEHRGWTFIGLDSCQGTSSKAAIQPPTFDFLEATLPKLDKKRPMVLYTHFPLGPMVPMRPPNAEQLLDRFKEHNLVAVFNGHLHGFTERKVGATVLTTNRCCSLRRANHVGGKEKGYFACVAREGTVTRRFVEVAVPAPATRP